MKRSIIDLTALADFNAVATHGGFSPAVRVPVPRGRLRVRCADRLCACGAGALRAGVSAGGAGDRGDWSECRPAECFESARVIAVRNAGAVNRQTQFLPVAILDIHRLARSSARRAV